MPPRASAAPVLGRLMTVVVLLMWTGTLVVDFRVPLTLLSLTALLAAVIGLWHPVLGLLGVGVLCTLDSMSATFLLHGGLWRWNTFNYWLLGVAILFVPLLLRRRDFSVRALGVLLACLGIGIMWSPDKAGGIQHIFGAVAMFGLLVYFVRAARYRDMWLWLGVVTSVTAIAAVLAFFLQEASLPYLNENAWSHAPLVAVFCVSLAFAAGKLSRSQQMVLAALGAMNAGLVFLSGSRGNLAMALVALLAIALMTPSLSQNVTIVVATIILGVGLTSLFPSLENRTVGRLAIMADRNETARRRTSGRYNLALGGWYIFREHPLGAGTGGFPVRWAALGRREGLSAFKVGVPMSAHAGWVKVLAENGVPGFFLLAVFVGSFAASGARHPARRPRVLGFMVTTVLAVGLLSTEFQSKSLWCLAAGATVIMGQPQRAAQHRRRRHAHRIPAAAGGVP